MDSTYLNCIKSSLEIEKCIYPNNLRRLRKEEFSQAKGKFRESCMHLMQFKIGEKNIRDT